MRQFTVSQQRDSQLTSKPYSQTPASLNTLPQSSHDLSAQRNDHPFPCVHLSPPQEAGIVRYRAAGRQLRCHRRTLGFVLKFKNQVRVIKVHTGLQAKIRTLETVLQLGYRLADVIACPTHLEQVDQAVCDFLRGVGWGGHD